jgi:signal transduction histidine kinase
MTRSLLGDIALALALAIVGIVVATGSDSWGTAPGRSIDAAGYALIGATGLVLVARRRWPVATLVVAAVATSAYLVAGYSYGVILIVFAVAVYTVARRVALPRSAAAAALSLVVLLAHTLIGDSPVGADGIVPGSAWVVVPFALGITVRVAREAAEREREEMLRQRADAERFRVAQEVHDVVGHGLAAIKMQSDVALHVMPKKPEQAEAALQAISRTSSDALEELRATLDIVRRSGVDSARSPVAGLAGLDELRQRMSDAGVQVEVETVGDRRTVPAVVDLTSYRIVQESLTNVLKHGENKVATVRVEYQTDTVLITVSNPATRVSISGNGLGIAGMQKRVTSLGGEFTAGSTADGRFEVHAVIPTDGHE